MLESEVVSLHSEPHFEIQNFAIYVFFFIKLYIDYPNCMPEETDKDACLFGQGVVFFTKTPLFLA